jgi:SAM-dependent methyltransferase
MQPPDTSLLDYDSAIDWQARLEREGPFLLRALAGIPSRRVLDLGAGTGEHSRWLAGEGFEVVAIEGVKERWEVAKGRAAAGVQTLLGDLGAVEQMVRGHFGAALCLGNTLPALIGVEALSRLLIGLRRRLVPGGVFVAQQRNHDALPDGAVVTLPERLVAVEGGRLVFRRVLTTREDGVVEVTDSVLRQAGSGDGASEPLRERHFFQQGWRQAELATLLELAGFRQVAFDGGIAGESFELASSPELVVVAS